jgi:pantoate--beta-alanine ligase
MSRGRTSPKVRVAPRIARTRTALRHELIALRAPAVRGARTETLAFVPTMGALHEGHRALIRHAREVADHVAVSIFVNPLQFGPDEDLDRYPRSWDADLVMCEEEGVELVFAPDVEAMYPQEQVITVSAGAFADAYEGAHRPGHFDGVLTVVCKLVLLVSPDALIMGEKDAQQLMLIRRMVTDLGIPVRVIGHPTVRDADGLALSSRNRYLSDAERGEALALSQALFAARDAAAQGADAARAAATEKLEAAQGLHVDYVALVDPETLSEIDEEFTGDALMMVAGTVGSTRLIDNLPFAVGSAS